MRTMRIWLLRLRASLSGRSVQEREFADEIESNLQLHIDDNIRSGMSPQEARRNALQKLGGVELAKERCRDQARAAWFEALLRDLRFAMRLLARNPGFTAVVVGSLAIGIAVNTSLFTVVNGLFLRPLPYRQADRLVTIDQPRQVAPLTELRQAQSFDGVAAFIPRNFAVAANGASKLVFGSRASANLFSLLGVQAALGRTFAPDEEDKPVVILSDEYWRKLSGNPQIVGQTITIGDTPYTVIGVLPADFTLWFRDASLWIPFRMTEGRTIARLKDGVSISHAQAEAQAVIVGLPAEPGADPRPAATTVNSLTTDLLGSDTATIWLLQAAVALVLLIVCANAGNLLLIRAAARHREFAIRAAIGAGRAQVFRQLATESALLAAFGGLLGLLLTKASVSLLRAWLPIGLARLLRGTDGLAIDHRVLAFTACSSLLAAFLFGLAPAMSGFRVDAVGSLKSAVATTREGRRPGSLLVCGEVGLALMLLIGAGLTLKSLAGLHAQYLGFSADRVLRAAVDLDPSHSPPEQRVPFFSGLVRRLENMPGVESVSMYGPQFFPFGGASVEGSPFQIQDQPDARPRSEVYTAGSQYFRTVRIPLLSGRVFTDADDAAARPVTAISESVARRYWGHNDPVGQRIRVDLSRDDSPWMTIVGVVGDVRNPLAQAVQPTVYRPWLQSPESAGILMIRTAADPTSLAPSVRSLIQTTDPGAPEPRIADLEKGVTDYVSPQRFTTSVFGAFAGLSLLLAVLGIYGVTRYWVGIRIPEIGLRLALGATGGDVIRLVLHRVMMLVLAGLLTGIIGALVLQRWMASQLYGVAPNDPAVLGFTALLMGLVALAAAVLPARAAGRIDPLTALRQE